MRWLVVICLTCLPLVGCKQVSKNLAQSSAGSWSSRTIEEVSFDAPFAFHKDADASKLILQNPFLEPTSACWTGSDNHLIVQVVLLDTKANTVFSPNMAVNGIVDRAAKELAAPVPDITFRNRPVSGFDTRHAFCSFSSKKSPTGKIEGQIVILQRDQQVWGVVVLYEGHRSLDAQRVFDTMQVALKH